MRAGFFDLTSEEVGADHIVLGIEYHKNIRADRILLDNTMRKSVRADTVLQHPTVPDACFGASKNETTQQIK